MNKYQEAFKDLYQPTSLKPMTLTTLQELVDRATPKKVTFRKQTHEGRFIHDDGTAETVKTIISYDYVCPICGHILNEDFQYQFCESCGQSLEWEQGEKK